MLLNENLQNAIDKVIYNYTYQLKTFQIFLEN